MDMQMPQQTLIKVVCLLVYTGLILLVPGMPNIYTFIINSLGFIITMSASVLLFNFLNTRPPAQKNTLNRILVLLILILFAQTIRSFLLSIVACFWNFHIGKIIESYPILTIAVLSSRLYLLAALVVILTLSCGRLLLVTNPVVFHKIQPSSCGAIFAGVLAIMICVLDVTFMAIACNENTNTRALFSFKIEMGIATKGAFNTSPVVDNANTTYSGDEVEFCWTFPTLLTFVICSILLEVVKVLFVLVKEYLNMKKKMKVKPTELVQVVSDQVEAMRTNPGPSRQRVLSCSESFPSSSRSRMVLHLRRHSVGTLGAEQKTDPVQDIVLNFMQNPNAPKKYKRKLNRADEAENLMLAKEVITKQCMRTASILTAFTVAVASVILSHVGELTMIRLTAYNLVVCFVLFDKDILSYIFSLLGFSS